LLQPAIEVRAIEVGEGEPVLFLHGFSLCSAHWAPLIARLGSRRSIAIDMPGHGQSEGVDYRGVDVRRWYTSMLTSCMDEMGLESAHVVGHSQGAMQGLWLAVDAPERVRSLVAIGTPAVALGARLDGSIRMLARPGLGRLMLSMPKPAAAYRSILAGTIGAQAVAAMPPELIRATYLATRRSGFGKTVSSYLREMFRGVESDPPRYVLTDAELRRITCSTLVIWGEADAYGSMTEAKARVAPIPGARFEVVPGGHEPWLDNLDVCAELLSTFLR
jgi:pimeloyl-ACP methyl ester carboxylesterase